MHAFHRHAPWRALGSTLVVTTLAWMPAAQAGVDSVISFAQAGRVDIILTGNAGGFDHLLEPVLVGGNGPFFAGVPSSGAWLVGTEGGSLLNLVGDPGNPWHPTPLDEVGAYFDDVAAGQEITFRLTNVVTDRIGGTDPDQLGTIDSQVFSGSSSGLNTVFSGGSVAGGTPGAPDAGQALPAGYTFVNFVSPTRIDVGFTDLDASRPDPFQNMTITLMLTPVPEPGSWALMLGGLAAVAGLGRRRMAR